MKLVPKVNKIRLLLVDDETWYVEALAQRLELRGFSTVTALDAAGALESFAREDFDAVVLDLRLPDGDGSEVLREMLKMKPHAWVAILTAHGGEDEREACLALGAKAFLNKPVRAEDLADVLQGAALGQPGAAHGEPAS